MCVVVVVVGGRDLTSGEYNPCGPVLLRSKFGVASAFRLLHRSERPRQIIVDHVRNLYCRFWLVRRVTDPEPHPVAQEGTTGAESKALCAVNNGSG